MSLIFGILFAFCLMGFKGIGFILIIAYIIKLLSINYTWGWWESAKRVREMCGGLCKEKLEMTHIFGCLVLIYWVLYGLGSVIL